MKFTGNSRTNYIVTPASTCLLAILVLSVFISAWNNPGIREYKINELIIISVIIDYSV